MSAKQDVFSSTLRKVLGSTYLILILLPSLIILDVYFYIESAFNSVIIIGNILLVLFIIPGIMIHSNYQKYCKGKYVLITDKNISLMQNGQPLINMPLASIRKIIWVKPFSMARWYDYTCFILEDEAESQLLVPCYIMSLAELRAYTLGVLKEDKMEIRKSIYPWIGKGFRTPRENEN